MRAETSDTIVPRLTGALVLAQRKALETIVGAAPVLAALDRIDVDLRDEYLAVMPVSWVRYTAPEAVLTEVARGVGRPMPELHEQCARLAVESTFKTLWRLVLRFTSDEALVARTPSMFGRTYDRGKLESRILAPGRAEVVLTGMTGSPEFVLRGARIGIEMVLRLSAREDVRVTATRQRDGATFHASWTP
jgi:hypothetical protein